MADNDPTAPHPEAEPGLVRDDVQSTGPELATVPVEVEGKEEQAVTNAQEPSAGAPDPVAVSNDEAAAAVPQQTSSPSPPDDGMPNSAEEHPGPSETTRETSSVAAPTIIAPTPAKRFTSMNINKKFLAKTAAAAAPSASSSATAPKAPVSASAARLAMPNPATPSKLVTKKLTTATPATPASGGWSLRATPPASLSSSPAPADASTAHSQASAKPPGPVDALKRPTLVSSTSGLSTDSRPSRDQSPVKAWASVAVPSGDLGRNLTDFPTAAEAAADQSEGRRSNGLLLQRLRQPIISMRRSILKKEMPATHFEAFIWTPKHTTGMRSMEDESNDFLGDVIEFGDGKTYTVPPEEEGNTTETAVSKENRFGDDYDRSWPRKPLPSDSDSTHAGQLALQPSRLPPTHGLPPRHPPGDGRVLFNERSNRLEPARQSASSHAFTSTGPPHTHGAPHSHVTPRAPNRRNSGMSASERPKVGSMRDPPPHARDPPPHAAPVEIPDNRVRRPSDARSTHSQVERRSSFLHDEERMRNFRADSGSGFHAMRRETSRDSRISTGERQSWGVALHRTTSQRTTTDSMEPALTSPVANDGAMRRSLLSPSQHVGTLPTIPSPHPPPATVSSPDGGSATPLPPVSLNAEREKFMKQAAERARRRKQEEEAAREEARERARKKAAELEALSKATLVSASPLVALNRKSSASGLSSGARSPIPKSPSVSPAILPMPDASSSKPKEVVEPTGVATTVSSWRAKPKPEPESTPPQIAPLPTTSSMLEGMKSIEELDQAGGPVEVLDFSDMSKLAETSVPEVSRRKPSLSGNFHDDTPASRRSTMNQPSSAHWDRGNRNEQPPGDHMEGRPRAPSASFARHSGGSSRPPHEKSVGAPNQTAIPPRSGFKEAPISALDDVMSRIKGVLTGMHADNEKPTATTVQPIATALTTTHKIDQPTGRANSGAASRWKGDALPNWRDNSNKRQSSAQPATAQPTEPFATTRVERSDSPPPAWNTFTVQLNKSTVTRPPMPKKQLQLAKLPPMPVRWDILTWDPPVERMSTRTLSRDDTFFPKFLVRGVLSARVHLPSTSSKSEAQPAKNESPSQRTRVTLAPDLKHARSPTVPTWNTPKGPAFSDNQWRKPQVAASTRNTLELQTNPVEEQQLDTTSRSPPPHHMSLKETSNENIALGSARPDQKQPDVAFHHSLNEKRPSVVAAVSFTVSSELDSLVISDTKADTVVPVSDIHAEPKEMVQGEVLEPEEPAKMNGDINPERAEPATGDVSVEKATQSPTPNSSILLTPPAKPTPPWQSSNSRLPDADFIKSVWQHTSTKEGTAENSIRGLPDDFPSSIPHSVQEMKSDEEPKSTREPTVTAPSTRPPHNAHRGFQQVPTSPIPMQVPPSYPNVNHLSPGQGGPSRPMAINSFSLPPPAPAQITAQPSPYAPYGHPAPPMMYTIPPSRIAPSPAPGAPQMWMQNQGYGRPSPPAGMYPAQHGHNVPYGPSVSQMPPPMSKPQVVINGAHGHPSLNPTMSHPMHMASPAMGPIGHMTSPHLAHAAPHMPGGPQHMYPGMNSPGGMGMGANMPYGVQRPAPTMLQQSPMQGPVPNGYGMSPNGSFGPNGYGRANVRSPVDGMPHHMALPHPQHGPMSPGTYHPALNGYARSW
ncbi:cell surface glycoprotein 1 [Ceratobasidium sp. AG-Ba]|nr:cell surface glycoprotein 1 [Ceratobasidium sp. AG-Ba]